MILIGFNSGFFFPLLASTQEFNMSSRSIIFCKHHTRSFCFKWSLAYRISKTPKYFFSAENKCICLWNSDVNRSWSNPPQVKVLVILIWLVSWNPSSTIESCYWRPKMFWRQLLFLMFCPTPPIKTSTCAHCNPWWVGWIERQKCARLVLVI